MNQTIEPKGIEVQIGFEPKLIQPGALTELVVKMIPFGEFLPDHIEQLSRFDLELSVVFRLPGFQYKSQEDVLQAHFYIDSNEQQERLQLIAGKSVMGTEYHEMLFLGKSLKKQVKGFFVPKDKGLYLTKVSDTGEHYKLTLFDF